MEIMLPPEYFSSMQSVSMLNSQESNAFIIPSFTFSQPISPFIAFVLYIGLTLTILRVHFILVTGESQISRLSGEVHTPV